MSINSIENATRYSEELDRLEKQIRKKLSHKSYCGALEKYVEPQNPDVNYRKYL